MSVLEKIQSLILAGKIQYTYHVLEEKLVEINLRWNLRLTIEDIKSVILTGEIVKVYDHDVRGKRYSIVGSALDQITELEIVCRIENNAVIITIYEKF